MKILLVILLVGCTKKEEPTPTKPVSNKVDVYIAYAFSSSSDLLKWERARDYTNIYHTGDVIDWTIERNGDKSFIIDGHDVVTSEHRDNGKLYVEITIIRPNYKYTYLKGEGDKQHFYEKL